MATALAIASPIPTFGTALAAHIRPSRFPLVDALVTVAVMAWFAAGLGSMIGESRGVPPAQAIQSAATRDVPTTLPQASTRPWISAFEKEGLI